MHGGVEPLLYWRMGSKTLMSMGLNLPRSLIFWALASIPSVKFRRCKELKLKLLGLLTLHFRAKHQLKITTKMLLWTYKE